VNEDKATSPQLCCKVCNLESKPEVQQPTEIAGGSLRVKTP
jgi:hypothetical protein